MKKRYVQKYPQTWEEYSLDDARKIYGSGVVKKSRLGLMLEKIGKGLVVVGVVLFGVILVVIYLL